MLHIWAHYPNDRIAFSPYLFARHDLMPLNRRIHASEHYFPATEEDFPEELLIGPRCPGGNPPGSETCRREKYPQMIQQAQYYDFWYLHDPPEDFIEYLGTISGLQQVKSRGRSSLWRYSQAKDFEPPLAIDDRGQK
jgi:hypothetical protein